MFNIGDETRIKTTGAIGTIVNKIEHDNRNDYLVRINGQEFWYLENILELATVSKTETTTGFEVGDEVRIKNTNTTGTIINKGEHDNCNNYLIRIKSKISSRESLWFAEPYLELATISGTDYSIKSDLHEKICKELNSIYKAKNADYGDSFVKVRQIVPNAILVRLNDKMQRLNKLMTTDEHNVKSESIRDTLLDLANYAIMELVEMEEEK